MIAVCINRSENRYLKHHYFTIGQKYEYTIERDLWKIKNDKGKVKLFYSWQFMENFKDLSEMRLDKLEGIGL